MRLRVIQMGIELISLVEIGAPRLEIIENGTTPLENARLKALAYYDLLKIPLFSLDSGLSIDHLPAERQPGAHVRGPEDAMDDEETIAYYSALASEFGGKLSARYQNAICLIIDEAHVYEYMGDDIASESFYLVAQPHEKRRPGFPLDSISVHRESGLYYFDRSGERENIPAIASDDGYTAFFRKALR